jgi:two-component system response regulator PilR (NtrC family)
MQSKLLRAIQERSVRPLGATAEVPSNARIVSATHRDLAADVQAGRFRQDLYFRLNVIHIPVPPLRERLDDLAPLCADILARIAAEAGVHPPPAVTREALVHLSSFSFPGNVRQLENLLHRALALSGADTIGTDELGGAQALALDSAAAPLEATGRAAQGAQEGRMVAPAERGASASAGHLPSAAPGALPADIAAYLDGVERAILEQALTRHRFNRTAAGASLGLSLRQMRYRMARLGIGADIEASDQP